MPDPTAKSSRNFRALLPASLSLCCLALAACGTAQHTDSLANLPLVTDWNAEDYKYRIGAGDELGLRLLLNPDLNSQVTVGSDGRGVFPLISAVPIQGLTIEEANATLTKAYSKILRNPAVEMLVYQYTSGQVFVGGEVKTPGAKVIKGSETVTQVINDAGGFQDTSGMNKVVLLRHRRDGHVLMRVVNVSKIYAGKTDEDMRVLPGDVVFVPRSTITEIDRIVHQYITNALPFSVNYNLNPTTTNTIPSLK